MQIPKPSSVISAMGLVGAIKAIPGFGALTPLFLAGDVITTKVVNEIINEFENESLLEWERRKAKSLNSALAWVQSGNNGAKMLQLGFIEFVSQEAHEKVLRGEINNFDEFQNFTPSIASSIDKNFYTYFYIAKKENNKTKYLIDSIFIR
ncbi:hypothetical protein ACSTS3_04630 [Aquimarina muelleri]|uniref:hypothetical protein n=1 Tax=Aquimarina muelleri TaxID=279356 RepID=UPI003F682E23